MARAAFAGLVLLSIVLTTQAARTDDIPVFVSVAGKGAIRVRIADGPITPCSSTSRKLFDGELSAGQTIRLPSSTGVVCVEHTYGVLRKVNWSPSTLVRRPCTKKSHICQPFLRVLLSTDKPIGLDG